MDILIGIGRAILWGALVLIAVLGVLVYVGVLVGGGLVLRQMRQLAAIAYLRCGAIIGMQAIKESRRNRRTHVKDLMARNPGVIFRLSSDWNIRCPYCGFEMVYRDRRHELQPKETAGPDETNTTRGETEGEPQ